VQQLKAVLIITGDPKELNCAIPELFEIAKGYGLDVDLVKDNIIRGED
jgi:hypothetical protein